MDTRIPTLQAGMVVTYLHNGRRRLKTIDPLDLTAFQQEYPGAHELGTGTDDSVKTVSQAVKPYTRSSM